MNTPICSQKPYELFVGSSLQQCSAVLGYANSQVTLQWQLWTLFHEISQAEADKPVVSTLESSLCFGCWGRWSDSSQCHSGSLYTIWWLLSRSQFAFDPVSWVNWQEYPLYSSRRPLASRIQASLLSLWILWFSVAVPVLTQVEGLWRNYSFRSFIILGHHPSATVITLAHVPLFLLYRKWESRAGSSWRLSGLEWDLCLFILSYRMKRSIGKY